MDFKMLYIFFAASILVGCANPKYIEPNEGSLATVELKNESDPKSNAKLEPIFYANAAECKQQLQGDVLEPGQSHTYKIQALSEMTFGYHLYIETTSGSKYCLGNFRFTPADGGKYLLIAAVEAGRCAVNLLDENTKKPANFQRIGWHTPLTGSGTFCKSP